MEDNYEYEKKTILIVDDEQKIVDLLVHNLTREGYNTIEANDGQTAINLALEKRPDLILLDVMLPRIDGLTVCKKIKNAYNVPILMVSAKDDELDKIVGLELGADDYIVKPFRTRKLISRIKSVLRRYGQKEENSNIIQYKNIKIDTTSAKVYKDNQEIIFTSLEYRILLMLFTNQNKLITREQLLEKIWDIAGNFVNDNTLTVYIKRIREKLDDKDGKIIQTVRGIGYKVVEKC